MVLFFSMCLMLQQASPSVFTHRLADSKSTRAKASPLEEEAAAS